jgi:hypothetical protein
MWRAGHPCFIVLGFQAFYDVELFERFLLQALVFSRGQRLCEWVVPDSEELPVNL